MQLIEGSKNAATIVLPKDRQPRRHSNHKTNLSLEFELSRTNAERQVLVAYASRLDELGLIAVPEPELRGLVEATRDVIYVIEELGTAKQV